MLRDDRDVLLYLAGVYWDDIRGTDRHLVEQLSRRIPVVWVDPPKSVIEPLRSRDFGRLRTLTRTDQVREGVRRVSLLAAPYPTRAGMVATTRVVLRRGLSHALKRLDVRVRGVVNATPYVDFDILPHAPDVIRLYYATDDFVAGAELLGLSPSVLRKAETRRTSEADLVAGVTPAITARWRGLQKPSFVLPNGCDPRAYDGVENAPLPSDVVLGGPVAGFIGQISARISLGLLEAVADAGIGVLIVGPVQRTTDRGRFEALAARGNVQWVGAKPFESLPSYLRIIDVGLTPYSLSDFNKASFPLKTLEYLAAGRPVVTTPLPMVASLDCPWIHSAATPSDFADHVRTVAAIKRTPDVIASCRMFAEAHSWDSRAERILGLLELA